MLQRLYGVHTPQAKFMAAFSMLLQLKAIFLFNFTFDPKAVQ